MWADVPLTVTLAATSVRLQTAEEDARYLLMAARTDWGRAVPQCPGWDAADLVRHMGGILGWMAGVVASESGSAGAPLILVRKTRLICRAGTWPALTRPLTSSAPLPPTSEQ